VAAAVATAAVVYVTTSGPSRHPEVAPATFVASGEPSAARAIATPASYVALVEQSGRLDQLLAELPAQRPLMTGATASTIAGLEDRIAFLDEQLAFSAAGKLPAPQRAALWSDRVELMNALVSVRYAEAQMNGF
jgi:flavin reductase (DIM6/NTAB) family NADH-FMN oxidoreductase RutF